uniref:Uncharacterized protein n=1 Tax=Zosterops lateralis melanops TaxID=1220523 RepID=A0A8D2PDQ9_ZOSLA
ALSLWLCHVQPLQNCIPSLLSSARTADLGLAWAVHWKLILAYISYISNKFKRDD